MNAHGTTHEEQLLFIRDGSFFEGLRTKSLLWTALLSLLTLLVLPNASYSGRNVGSSSDRVVSRTESMRPRCGNR